MRFYFCLPLILFFCFTGYSQTKFEPGYFINNNGKKTNCLIKNIGWRSSPTQFEYKLSENDTPKFATIKTIKEFSVGEIYKFERYTVQMDLFFEPSNKKELDKNPKPEYVEKTLFLRTIVEGKASLYLYDKNNFYKFFYTLENEVPKQLFYKKYLVDYRTTNENNQYKQQLFNNLKCKTISSEDALNTDYFKNDLINFFEKYNNCTNTSFKVYKEKPTKTKFNLTLRPGLSFNSLLVDSRVNDQRDVDFGNQTNYRFGLEAELVLAFNNNKWSLLFEPTYQYYKAEKQLNVQYVKLDYSYIEFPVGLRHYFYLGKKSKIFVNALYLIKTENFDSKIDYEILPSFDTEVNTNKYFTFGVGYKYGKRLSIEFRFYNKKPIFLDSIFDSTYKNFSIVAGFTLF